LTCAELVVTLLAGAVLAPGALVPVVEKDFRAEQTWLATPAPVTALFAQAR